MTDLINTTGIGTGEISTGNMIVWLIRIAIPILFFWIWYRQGPGKEREQGETKHRRSRAEFLSVRWELGKGSAPDELSNLRMSVYEAPSGPRQVRNNRSNDARAKRGDKSRNSGGSDHFGFKQDRAQSNEFDLDFDAEATPTNVGTQSLSPIPAKKVGRAVLNNEELSNFSSLLNYTAFAHKNRSKPTFLCTKERPPPPPPPKMIPLVTGIGEISSAENDNEAQNILKALVNEKLELRGPEVAQHLYTQLSDCETRLTESTFALLVEACVNGGDLKASSNFLMKMETNSFTPSSELLDKVMDLYSVRNASRPEDVPDEQSEQRPATPEKESPEENQFQPKSSASWGTGKVSSRSKLTNASSGNPWADAKDDDEDDEYGRQDSKPVTAQTQPSPNDDLDDDPFASENSGCNRQTSQAVETPELMNESLSKTDNVKVSDKLPLAKEDDAEDSEMKPSSKEVKTEIVKSKPSSKEVNAEECERVAKLMAKKAERKARKLKEQQKNDDEALTEAVEIAKAEREEAQREEEIVDTEKKDTESSKSEKVARKKETLEKEAAAQDAAEKAAKELEAKREAEERERVTHSLDSLTASCVEVLPSSKAESKGRKEKSSSDKKKKEKASSPKVDRVVAEAVINEIVPEVESHQSLRSEKDDATPGPEAPASETMVEEDSLDKFEPTLTGKQKKASRAQQRAEEKEAKRKEEEEEQERKRVAQEAARAAEEAARVAEQAARDAEKTARIGEEAQVLAAAAQEPRTRMKAPVAQLFKAAKAAEAKQNNVSSNVEKVEGGSDRTPLEKEILKLEKKFREVEKLKERVEAGETLESLQLKKIEQGEDLGSRIAELQLQRALERAQELKVQEDAPIPSSHQFYGNDGPDYSPGTPEPGDLPPIPMPPPTRTPLRQWARDARGATPFVGTPGFGPGMLGKGMPQVGMVGFAPQGSIDGSNGMPHPGEIIQAGMTAPFCGPCIPGKGGDMRTPLGLPGNDGNPPQFIPMFGNAPMGLNGEPVLCMPSLDVSTDKDERWECCWEWVRNGWCPRGDTCRWEHPPLNPSLDFENGLHMQQIWPEGEAPPNMVLVPAGLPGGDFTSIPGAMSMPSLAMPMVPMEMGNGEPPPADPDEMPDTPRSGM